MLTPYTYRPIVAAVNLKTSHFVRLHTLAYLSRPNRSFDKNGINPFTGAYSPGRTFGFPFRGFLITHRHTVGLLWTSDQPVTEASTYTGQHNV
jgi:hypothetical protein